MDTQVKVNQVVSNLRAFDSNAAIAPETIRTIADAVLPFVREMLDHDQRVRNETSLHNGYVDRMERGSA
jgi:hypothetical protein